MPASTYRRILWEEALDQYGYVTTADALRLGVPGVELRKLARRGFLVNLSRGLYRFPDAPSDDRASFMEAVLWVGQDAALSHDAVLALHGLAAANPRSLRVVTPHRIRKTHPRPDVTVLQDSLPAKDLTTYFGIPSTTVARALLDCRRLILSERLAEAAKESRQAGLLLREEDNRITRELARP